MTESEKAQLGQLYNANHDPQLLNKRTWAKNLCMEYNQLRWDEGAKRTALLQELLGICGEDAVIEPPFYVDYGKNICIGRGFYANHNLVILDGATVTIGNNVWIGAGVLAAVAIGAIKAIREAGYSIPEDISIVGFDDIPFSAVTMPALTTMRISRSQMGTLAVDLIRKRIKNLDWPGMHMHIGGKLIVRNSTRAVDD